MHSVKVAVNRSISKTEMFLKTKKGSAHVLSQYATACFMHSLQFSPESQWQLKNQERQL